MSGPGELTGLLGSRLGRGAGFAVLGFLTLTIVVPAVAMTVRFIRLGNDAGPALRPASIVDIVAFTAGQATASTVLTLLVALPITHVVATYSFPGRRLVEVATLVPFVLPTVVVAVAVRRTFGDLGLAVDSISGSVPAVLFAHVVFNVAVVVRLVGAYWRRIDDRYTSAAAALGAAPIRRFLTISLPLLRPALVAAAGIVFLFTFTSFGVILILGGLARSTLDTEIYRLAITRNDFRGAAILAVVQIVFVAGLAVINRRLQAGVPVAGAAGNPRQLVGIRRTVYVGATIGATLLLLMSPFWSLLLRSLSVGDRFGFDHYLALFDRAPILPVSAARALLNSLVFASLAALVATLIGVTAAVAGQYRSRLGRLAEVAALVPLGISAVTLGFGYLIAFTFWDLRRSPVLVVVAHAVIGTPFVVGAAAPSLRAVPGRLLEASATLGADVGTTVRSIVVPLVAPSVAAGAGFAAVVSLGEFGAAGFLARGRSSYTAPQAIFALFGQPGAALQGQAAALCVLLGLVVIVVVLVIDRVRGDSAGGWL